MINLSISRLLRPTLFVMTFLGQVTVHAWDVDLSRRQSELSAELNRGPSSINMSNPEEKPSLAMKGLLQSLDPVSEVVILNTTEGFVPESIRLKKGKSYRVHVVNVNDKQKNSSFVVDAFSEHHGTYFGQPKSFDVSPKVEGIFSFQCPETAKQGRFIIVPETEGRKPAGE
jgi:hypothetical protein